MPNYSFEHIEGQSKPSKTVEAENQSAAYTKIADFLAEKPGRAFVSGSIKMTDFAKIDDPVRPWETFRTAPAGIVLPQDC